jgi:plastocyanin
MRMMAATAIDYFVSWSLVFLFLQQQHQQQTGFVLAVPELQGEVGINFPWCIPDPETPYELQSGIKEGDTVFFVWSGVYHNVYLYPSGNCADRTDREYLGEFASETSYTFNSEDIGKNLTFVCDVSSHCASGQIVTFANVAPANRTENVKFSTTNNPCGDVTYLSSSTNDSGSSSSSSSRSSSSKSSFLIPFLIGGAVVGGLHESFW